MPMSRLLRRVLHHLSTCLDTGCIWSVCFATLPESFSSAMTSSSGAILDVVEHYAQVDGLLTDLVMVSDIWRALETWGDSKTSSVVEGGVNQFFILQLLAIHCTRLGTASG